MEKKMKELIKNYKENENEEIVERILKFADADLTDLKYDEGTEAPSVEDPLMYVAYRIRALMMKDCFRERNQRHIFEASQQDKLEYQQLFSGKNGQDLYNGDAEDSWINELAENPQLDVDVDEMCEYNFSSVWRNEKKLIKHYGGQAYELFNLCKKFSKLSQDSEEFKQDFIDTKEKLIPYFVESLKYGLIRVDVEKSEKEIVKYINLVINSRFFDAQIKATEKKRVKNEGVSYVIKPTFDVDDNVIWMMILKKSLLYVGVDAFDEHLNDNQKEFMLKVYKTVKEEIEAENQNAFHFDKDGKPYMNKRYFADLMGMGENNFKNKLKRLEDNIGGNWKSVFSDFYSNKAM